MFTLASLGAQEKTNCTSVLWSIDSCQNRVSPDQHHLTVPRAQVSTHRGRVFFDVICWQITSFKWSQTQVYVFQWFIWNMLCLCHYGPALLGFWFQTDLGRENSVSFFKKIQAGKIFSYHNHALVTLYVQFLSSDWSNWTGEFMRKIYAASWKLFSLTAEADRVLCQLMTFLTVFFHWMYKMKYSSYQESSVIHGWFVYWVFGWEMRGLSKFGNPISDCIVFAFHLA